MIESGVSFTIEKLRDPLIVEVKLLYGVSDQIKALQVKLKRMKCFLRDVDRKQDESGETMKNLISEIRKLAYDVKYLIENYAIELALTSALNSVYNYGIFTRLEKGL